MEPATNDAVTVLFPLASVVTVKSISEESLNEYVLIKEPTSAVYWVPSDVVIVITPFASIENDTGIFSILRSTVLVVPFCHVNTNTPVVVS